MSIDITDTARTISYVAVPGQTDFVVPFVFYEPEDIDVYRNGDLIVLSGSPLTSNQYAVTQSSDGTGAIQLGAGAGAGDEIVIASDVPIERTTNFPLSGIFPIETLNRQFNEIVIMIADLASKAVTLPISFGGLEFTGSVGDYEGKVLGVSAGKIVPVSLPVEPDALPSFFTQPSISGNPVPGAQLTLSDGVVLNGAITSRLWLRDGSPILGEYGQAYTLTPADAGALIEAQVFASNAFGSTVGVSNVIGPVVVLPSFTHLPVISGVPQVGQTLSGTDGTFENGVVSDRQWFADGAVVGTGSTYQVALADVGKLIGFSVTLANDNGETTGGSLPVGPVVALDPDQENFGSLMFADENMEANDINHSSILELVGSNGAALVDPNGVPAERMFATAGSLVIGWDFPAEQYRTLNRGPFLVATQTNRANRALGLQYFAKGASFNPTNHYWVWECNGSNSVASKWRCESNRSIPNEVSRIAAHVFVSGGNIQLDILDLDTQTWYYGTPVAAPSGWAGLDATTYNLCVGNSKENRPIPADYDQGGVFTPQGNPGARGSFADLLITDNTLIGSDIEDIFLSGDDPVAVSGGAANVRLYAPLTSSGDKALAVTSNIAGIDASSFTQTGVILPGPNIRPQSASAYVVLDSIPYPGALVRGSAKWEVTGKSAGLSGALSYRYVARANGQALTGWIELQSYTLTGTDLTFEVPALDNVNERHALQVRFASDDTVVGSTHCDVQSGYHIVCWSQSEGGFATLEGSNNTGGITTLNVRPVNATTRTVSFIEPDGAVKATGVRPGLIGEAGITLANTLRQDTDAPIFLGLHVIYGTSRRDLMDDSIATRQWASEVDAHSFVLNRSADGAVPVSGHIDIGWEASDNVIPYGREVFAPWLTGAAYPGSTYSYGNIDHYVRDGTFTDAPYYVIPCNRATPGNSTASTTTDLSTEADQRDSQRNWGHLLAYEIGVPTTTHSMEGEVAGVLPANAATHPNPGRLDGGPEMGAAVAETASLIVGTGQYPGAVFYETIRAGSASDKVIVQIGTGRRYPGQNLADPDTGYDTTGTTVPTTYTLETKEVGGNPKWAFEAKLSAGGASSIANVTSATFISDTECELTLSSAYTPSELEIRYQPGTCGTYKDTALNQDDWRAGQHFFAVGSKRYPMSGSNQPLVL